jgi:hypothetical protein
MIVTKFMRKPMYFNDETAAGRLELTVEEDGV